MKWLLLALLGAAPGALADDWIIVATTSDGDVHSYAGDKLHFENDAVAFWRKVEFRMPLPVRSALAQSALYREQIDCRSLRLRTLGYLYYGADGAIIENVYAPDAPPVAILADTPSKQMADALCVKIAAALTTPPAESVDELDKLRREVEALQDHVQRLRRGLEVKEAAGTGR